MTAEPLPTSRGRRSVSSLLVRLLTLITALVVVNGLLGSVALYLSTRSLATLIDEVGPASQANERILQDLLDAETGVRAWGLSGADDALTTYREGLGQLSGHQAELAAFAEGRPALAGLVDELAAAADAWRSQYAEVRLARPGGTGTFDPDLFVIGTALFDEIRRVHDEIQDEFADITSTASSDAERRLRDSLVLLTGVALLGGLVALFAGRRVLEQVREPLADLEETVRRLTAGEDARAAEEGPREIREVAIALNSLAEERERGRAVEQLIQEEVRSLDSARDDFVSNVSHELRTPLTTIVGYLELIQDEFGGHLEERHQRMLDASTRNVERLSSLIEDLLTLSRAANQATDLEQVHLGVLVADVATDVRLAAQRREIEIVVDVVDDVLVLADRSQLSRAFLNLVSNAVKFSPQGSQVRVEVQRLHDEVEVRVIDRGIGIPAADLEKVGNRFFRASNAISGQLPGTGLGLRIVQTIIGQHGGGLRLDSVEGEGTTAIVTLPLPAQGSA